MTTEKFNIVFNKFPLYVILADARRPKFWHKKDKLTKRLQEGLDAGDFFYANGILCTYKHDTGMVTVPKKKGTRILHFRFVKNSETAGTPRRAKISGQLFWSGQQQGLQISYRQKLKDQLRDYFVPSIVRQWGPTFKLTPALYKYVHIEYIFYMPLVLVQMDERDLTQDIGNFGWLYGKIFEDILQDQGILQTDSPLKMRGAYHRYVDIENEEERRLEVKIHFCINEQSIE